MNIKDHKPISPLGRAIHENCLKLIEDGIGQEQLASSLIASGTRFLLDMYPPEVVANHIKVLAATIEGAQVSEAEKH